MRIERRAVSVEVLVGTEIPGGGGRGRLYITLHCHHYNDSCIKSYDSHFSVSLIVRVKVARQCPQTTTFEESGEQKRNRTEVLLLISLTAKPNRLFSSSFSAVPSSVPTSEALLLRRSSRHLYLRPHPSLIP